MNFSRNKRAISQGSICTCHAGARKVGEEYLFEPGVHMKADQRLRFGPSPQSAWLYHKGDIFNKIVIFEKCRRQILMGSIVQDFKGLFDTNTFLGKKWIMKTRV